MSYLTRNGYYPKLYINGQRIADSRIDGAEIQIRRSEGDPASMVVKLRPATGSQNLTLYQGLPIILDVQTTATLTNRVFTGIIDIDEYDILKETITLICTDNRVNVINTLPALVDQIGYWSEDVFGKSDSVSDKLEKRMLTIPYSFDFNAYGAPTLTSWEPKASADYTLGNSDVYRRTPVLQRTKRADIINTINLAVKYSYTRLHHKEVTFNWASNIGVCDFLIYGYSLCSKDMVRQAANAVRWPLKAPITFDPVYASGSYRCSFATGGRHNIAWFGTTTQGINYADKQEAVIDGQATTTLKYDAAGNVRTSAAVAERYSSANLYCIGATWIATKRFTQNIIEDYTITVTAPQSTAQYGVIQNAETFAIDDEYDAAQWEEYKSYSDQPDEAVNLTNTIGGSISDYIIDKDIGKSDFYYAMLTIINKAKTTILKSHRQNTVKFETDIWPDLDLTHTVELNCTRLTCKGKVSTITHHIICGTGEAYTEVELSFYSSTGSQAESSLAPPTRPTFIPVVTGRAVNLQSHYGEDPSTVAARKWTGHVGNRWYQDKINPYRTQYSEAFIVDTPAIDPQFRDDKKLAVSQTYNISIPNNAVTVTFNGKLS